MTHRETRGPSGAGAFTTAVAAGVAGAGLLCLVEVWGLNRVRLDFMGAPPMQIVAVYGAFGAVVGAVVGLVLGAFARLRRWPAERSVAWGVALPGLALTLLFMVRTYTVPELRTLPWALMATLVAVVVVWGMIAVSGERILRERDRIPSAAGARRVALVLVGGVAAMGAASVWRAGALPDRSDRARADAPNIVLVTVDALRRDHLGLYGYDRETSPTIDRLGREGVVFERAYSHGNRTILAMPALFTSLYPSEHGAVGFHEIVRPLPQDRTTIAEMLRDAGYTTVGLMSNIYLKRPFAMTQGFDRVDDFNTARLRLSVYRVLLKLGLVERMGHSPRAHQVTERALRWWRRSGDRPLFLFVHYMDVHHPYDPPPEVFARFNRHTTRFAPSTLFDLTVGMLQNPPPLKMARGDLEGLIDLYDACIRNVDDELSRLVDEIRNSSKERETIVVVTSDHGDEFLEHGSLYHNNLLIEELIRVPLVVWSDRGLAPRRVKDLARHVDVLPTLAAWAGANPPSGIRGRSLVECIRSGSPTGVEESIAEGDFCTALVTPRWKLMCVDTTGSCELYDLAGDPGAFHDVASEHPDTAAAMRERIDRYLETVDREALQRTSRAGQATLDQLRALGYVQ